MLENIFFFVATARIPLLNIIHLKKKMEKKNYFNREQEKKNRLAYAVG